VRHLLSTELLNPQEVASIFTLADLYLSHPNLDPSLQILQGKVVFSLFFENSTRTRVSFELAAHRLGAKVVSVTEHGSSIAKGETVMDSLQNLAAMRPDAMIVRLSETGLLGQLAPTLDFPLLSGGEGSLHHPSQAMLDAYTIYRAKGTVQGQIVAICGDIARSRVAHSNIELLGRLGAEVRLVAPEPLQLDAALYPQCKRMHQLSEGVIGADVVMMLRTQHERALPSGEIYYLPEGFCLDHTLIAQVEAKRPGAMVMHPGPIHRNVEITSELADDVRYSHIMRQVQYGVAIRMALLTWSTQ
jgi:aspartate carbamoyltransferase catalytic subunit